MTLHDLHRAEPEEPLRSYGLDAFTDAVWVTSWDGNVGQLPVPDGLPAKRRRFQYQFLKKLLLYALWRLL